MNVEALQINGIQNKMKPLISDETLKLLEANEKEQQQKTEENIRAQYLLAEAFTTIKMNNDVREMRHLSITKGDIEDIIYGLKCFETYDEGYSNPLIEKLQALIDYES
jgi:hypothetical protein